MFSLFGSPFVEDPWALQRQRAAAEEAKRRRLMAQRQAQAQAAYEQQLRAEAARRRQLQQQLEQQRQQEAYAEYLHRLRRQQQQQQREAMTMADDDDDMDATPEPMVCHQPFCDCRSTRTAKHQQHQQTSPSAARRRPASARAAPRQKPASAAATAVPVVRPKTAASLSPTAARREQLLTVKRVRAAQMLRATNAARKIQRWFRACRAERAAAQAAAEQDRRQTAAATITAFMARLVAARQARRVLDSLRELRDKDAAMDRAMAEYRAEYDDKEEQDDSTSSASLPSPMQEEDEEIEVLASLFDDDDDDAVASASDEQPTPPRMPRGKAALLLAEQLERLLISLDTVESHGNAFVRAQRKALVKKANRYLAELDRVKTRPALEVDMNGHLLSPSP